MYLLDHMQGNAWLHSWIREHRVHIHTVHLNTMRKQTVRSLQLQ